MDTGKCITDLEVKDCIGQSKILKYVISQLAIAEKGTDSFHTRTTIERIKQRGGILKKEVLQVDE